MFERTTSSIVISVTRIRNFQQSRRIGWNLYLREMHSPVLGISKHDCQSEREMRQMWNWVTGTQCHRHRHQRRTNLLPALLPERGLLRFVEIPPPRQANFQLFQFLETDTRALRLTIHDVGDAFADQLHLLPSCETVIALFFALLSRFLSKPRHANHEELIEVRADNRDESQTLAEWCARIFGQCEDATLKRE